MKPKTWFVPSDTIPHPETFEPVFEAGVAYSIAALKSLMAETGVDTLHGTVMDLPAARIARGFGDISRFVMLKREE